MGENIEKMERIKKDLIRDTYIQEGTMVAFPLCFPGASVPIPADESYITALDVGPENFVYGGTSGRKTHLFVGMLHGALGAVFDMGVVEGADHCAAVCCGEEKFAACVNGPEEGRLIARKLQDEPDQLIQEWGFTREPFEDWGCPAKGEKILHAVRTPFRKKMIGLTEHHLFSVDLNTGKLEIIREIHGQGRLVVSSGGTVLGKDEDQTLWIYNPDKNVFTSHAITLPRGKWKESPNRWARDPGTAILYTTDDTGQLFSFQDEAGFQGPLAKTPFLPVGPMAVTFDGRLFGFSGEGIAHFFIYDPETGVMEKHGMAVSFLERRRYGYQWGDAVTGKDGQIFFGEDDFMGHLWIYFPAIKCPIPFYNPRNQSTMIKEG